MTFQVPCSVIDQARDTPGAGCNLENAKKKKK